MDLTKLEMQRIVAKVRREALARAAAVGRAPDAAGFRQRQAEHLKLYPHLAEHRHCGLCPDSADTPRKRVKLPNGIIIHSSWYKVPTTDADSKLALREQRWLIQQRQSAKEHAFSVSTSVRSMHR